MTTDFFAPQPLTPLTLSSLTDWQIVTVTGPDAEKYLQGQLTYDLRELANDMHVLCAHCDAKGKVWSTLRLFRQDEGFTYLLHNSVCDAQIDALKKYAIFSKVTITVSNQYTLLGLMGTDAKQHLAQLYPQLPDQQHTSIYHPDSHSTLLYFSPPYERFLLMVTAEQADTIQQHFINHAEINNNSSWLAMDIASGIPVLEQENCLEFIPQAINLQALSGISFTKGCYTGQETVARAKYRGANKRALYWLAGSAVRQPTAGEELELKLGENWRRTGRVLASTRLNDGSLWLQAVLNSDLSAESILRVYGDENSQLTLQPLPYSLD